MPSHPSATTGAACYFNFPSDQNYHACIDDANVPCNSVHYVTTQYSWAQRTLRWRRRSDWCLI